VNKKELQTYVNMRLMELQACADTGEPTYNMVAINARISELNDLLKMFGKEN